MAQNTGTPTPQNAPSWKPPANAPSWAQNKTPEEILGIAQQLYAHVETMQAPAPQPQGFVQQNQQAQSPDDYLTVGQLQQQAQQFVAPLMESNAQLALQSAKNESPDIFAKFGPEVLQYWQRLPANQRNLDGARMVVKLVQGNHFEELKQEAIRAAQQGDASFRSGTAVGTSPNPGSPLVNEEYPETWRKKAETLGLSMDDLRDFAKGNGLTVKEYMDKFVKVTVGGGR